MVRLKKDLFRENRKPIRSPRKLFMVRVFIDLKFFTIVHSIKNKLASFKGEVLEVGCGNHPLRFLLKNAAYHGIDNVIAREFAYQVNDVKYYEGDMFPEKSDSYDSVFHTEVLEHIKSPDIFLKECFRVLKPRGELLFTVSFSCRFHYIPYDYYRYTPTSLRDLLSQAGFVDIQIMPQGTDITVACHKVILIFFRLVTEEKSLIKRLFSIILAIFFLPLLILTHFIGILSYYFNIGSTNDTLGYAVMARKPDKS